MLIVAFLNVVMLSVTMLCGVIQSVGYANGQYTELLLDDNHSKCCKAQCRFAYCYYVKCRGAPFNPWEGN